MRMSPSLTTIRGYGYGGLFSDEVFTSTDLNRRSGEVLNHARKRPVTIARNNEQFAPIRREEAAGLIKAVAQLYELLDVFQAALTQVSGLEPPPSVAWVTSLSEEDQRAMIQECLRAVVDEDWDGIGDLIHEWRESALVTESGVISQVMAEGEDEQPIEEPAAAVDLDACD